MTRLQVLKVLLIGCFGIGLSLNLNAQQQLNFGRSKPLSQELMPRSKVPIQWAVRREKQHISSILDKISTTEYLIKSGWELREAQKVTESQLSPLKEGIKTDDWYNAVVPGTVLTTLVDNGVYPDPYWGINNIYIPDTICRMDWWYRNEFTAPDNRLSDNVRLVFEGINYRAQVWLNGRLLGNINGAFTRGIFDVTKIIKNGDMNVLAIRIIPPNNPGIPHEQNANTQGNNGGILCLDGPTFISSEGWDWVPGIRDRNIGIWQDVKLDYTGSVYFGDSQIITDLPLPDTTSTNLILKTSLKNSTSRSVSAEITFEVDRIKVTKKLSIDANSQNDVVLSPEEFSILTLKNPHLWWPNGYGEQYLYDAKLTLSVNGKLSDERKIRFGVREFDYQFQILSKEEKSLYVNFNPTCVYQEQKPILDIVNKVKVQDVEPVYAPRLLCDLPHKGITPISEKSTSPFLVLKVNGVKVFCKGGNWGMDDAMKNVTRDHLEPYFKLHKKQNFNMIRNWTGESTESMFYDLCDEYGILVFNDFWLSTEGYNLNVADDNLFMANVNETIIRQRNHPSIAIWCPRNEGFAPDNLEREISKSIALLDGTRHYIGSSIRLNTTNSGPWTPEKPVTYYNRNINRGFNSEIGAPCVPTAESMRKMMAEEDLWPISDVWAYHTWLVGGWLKFREWEKMTSDLYGSYTGVDDFCKKSQLFGYDVYRAIFEAANSRLWNNTSGVLLWMSHPAWPSTAYQTYTWDYETTGPYYGAKSACKPLHIQMKLNDRKVQIINNNSKQHHKLIAHTVLYDINGKKITEKVDKFSVSENSVLDCYTLENRDDYPDVYLIRLLLEDDKGVVLDHNDYWDNGVNGKDFVIFNSLPKATLTISSLKKSSKGKYSFILQNIGKSTAIGVKLNVRNSKTEQVILPAYFSEGYLTMLPKEKRLIELEFNENNIPLTISTEGYNVPFTKLKYIDR